MERNSHNSKSLSEHIQLKPHFPRNTKVITTVSEQPGSSQTTNAALTAQQGYCLHPENTAQPGSELPELSSHPTQPEQVYNEIADKDVTRTAPVGQTEERPVQLPLHVNTRKLTM